MGEGSKASGPSPNKKGARKPPRARFNVQVPTEIHGMSSDQALPILCDIFKGRALVSFSGGKDAVGVVLALRAAGFDDLHLYHMYGVPGLRLVEQGLRYYEALWQTRITRVAHPGLHAQLENREFQPWHRYALIEMWGPEVMSFDDLSREVRRDLGWSKEVPTAVGVRMDDSIFRAAALRKSGVYNRTRNVLYPVFDWSRDRLRQAFIDTGTRLAPDYRFLGRSFSGDGIDFRFVYHLRKHYPDDYQRLRLWFPCIGAELARYLFSFRAQERAMSAATSFTL